MHSKLHINLTQGIIDVEGDLDLVKTVYEDFKERIKEHPSSTQPPAEEPAATVVDANTDTSAKVKRRSKSKKKTKSAKDSEITINADVPQLDKSLDTSSLADYLSRFKPSNHPERVLVFLKFLVDELNIENPNTDQVYTCYEAADEKIPKAFSQAFRDASGRRFGYIDFNSSIDIPITTAGLNHFKFGLKKKDAE